MSSSLHATSSSASTTLSLPTSPSVAKSAIALAALGVTLREGGRVEEAIGELTTARDLFQRSHDAEPANLTYGHELAIALADLGVTLREGAVFRRR